MKARIFRYITAMTIFAALRASLPLAAQEQGNQHSSVPRKYQVRVLPGLGGLSGAFSINDRSWVAGISNPPGDAFEHALLWRSGQMTDLGTLGGYNSSVPFPNNNEIGWLTGPVSGELLPIYLLRAQLRPISTDVPWVPLAKRDERNDCASSSAGRE
jgi:probable HAF family extracellular repeat protein